MRGIQPISSLIHSSMFRLATPLLSLAIVLILVWEKKGREIWIVDVLVVKLNPLLLITRSELLNFDIVFSMRYDMNILK